MFSSRNSKVKATSKSKKGPQTATGLDEYYDRGYIGPAVTKPQPQGALKDREKDKTNSEQRSSKPQPSRPGAAVAAGQPKVQVPIEQLGVPRCGELSMVCEHIVIERNEAARAKGMAP